MLVISKSIFFYTYNQADALNAVGLLENIVHCINDVHSWMNSHSLKLNSAKCEFLLFGSKTQLSQVDLK